MKIRKIVLLILGFSVPIGLLYYNVQLRKNILFQKKSISVLDEIKFDSLVLKEYENNFTLLNTDAECNSMIDSMINSSKFLKNK